LINFPPHKAINVHASLLPKYRGAAPINWAIVNGERETGVSIFRLVKKMDAGDIVAQASTLIGKDENAEQLHDRLAHLAAPVLVETLDRIADGSAVFVMQDASKVTLAPKMKKEDGFLDFAQSAESIERKIRGFWPWPGATCDYVKQSSGKREPVTLAAAEVIEKEKTLAPGTLDECLDIICGRGGLKIMELKPAGKGVMEFRDFVNGRNTRAGDRFETQQ
jgi:methionyl-tRNA formyltransferase